MTDVWSMPAIARWEKDMGKHPTQKAAICIGSHYYGGHTTRRMDSLIRLPVVAQLDFVNLSERRYLALIKKLNISSWEMHARRIEYLTFFLYRSKIKDFKPLQNSSEKSVIRGHNPLYQKHEFAF